MGEERKVCKVLVGRPVGKRPLGRSRRRWEDGIRMDLAPVLYKFYIPYSINLEFCTKCRILTFLGQMVMYHPLQCSLTLHFMQIMYLLVSY
jgi:hypothetical protein